MNKTTENLLQALKNYVPPETKPVIWKLIYDPETGKTVNLTTEETDLPHIIITREEADTYPHQDPRVSVIDGKMVRKIKKLQFHEIPYRLQLFPDNNGNIVTDDYNMLIINNNGTNRWRYG